MTDQEVLEKPARRSRKPLWVALAVAAVIALAIAAALVWYFNRTVPEEVSLEGAVAGVTSTTTTAPEATTTSAVAETTTTVAPEETTTTSGAGSDGIDGTWQVDTSIGEFSFEESSASFAGFRVNEELSGIGSAVAVGRTPLVAGTIVIDGTTLSEASIEADLTGIITNESRRDSRVQSALNTREFPVATFVLTEPIDLGAGSAAGEPVIADAMGELTVNGITQPVAIPIEAVLVEDLIVVVGSIDLVFADFDVAVPSAPAVLSAEDHGIMEMQLLFRRT